MNNKTSSNLKDIYKEVNHLNSTYYNAFKKMNITIRQFRGCFVNMLLVDLLNKISGTYFDRDNIDDYKAHLKDLYLILKKVEFNLRLCYEMNFINDKDKLQLNSIIGKLSNLIKSEQNHLSNELC